MDAQRHFAVRGTSLAVIIGVGLAAGCAAPTGPEASAEPAAKPAVPAAVAQAPAAANEAVAPPAEDAGSVAVIDSVNDHVARTERILAQRREARQAADDLKELRAARDGDAIAARAAAPDLDPAEIERLAAEIRRRRGQELDPNAKVNETGAPANVADAKPAIANNASPVTAPPPPASWDAVQAEAVGTLAAPPTKVEIAAASPSAAGGDPLLAVNERFAGRVAKDPKSLDAQLELQLVRFLRNQPVPEATDIAPLPAEDRELVSAVADALSNFRSVVRESPNSMTADKARPFLDMAERIRSRADLNVASMALCERVVAYGNYEPISPPRFAAGQPNWAVFYCEVEGFLSQLGERELWDTKLSLALRLYREDGLELWTPAPETVVDSSRRRRRDFFIAKKIQLPLSLTPGRYLLKASVRDLQANRVAESTLQLDVVAK